MPSPWRVKALRSDGQVVPTLGGGIHAAELFGQRQGAFGLGPLGQEPAGLPAQRVAVVPAPLLGSALGNERVLSEPTSSSPPPPPMRLRPAA
jgi:hypothetical protein